MGRDARRKKSDAERLARMRTRMRTSSGSYRVKPGTSTELLRRAAALHEAGHAVAAIVVGLDVSFVILHVQWSPTEQRIGGYCETAFNPGTRDEAAAIAAYSTPEMLRARAVQVLAGPAAEWIGHTHEGAENVDLGAEDDDRKSLNLAVQMVGRDGDLFGCRQGWDDEAHQLIREHWPACCAVAAYLFEHPNEQMPGSLVAQFMTDGARRAPHAAVTGRGAPTP